MNLQGRTVIVTGASSGIGREIAREFARAGTNVVLASRSRERLNALAEELADLPGQRLVVPTDVTDPWAVEAMVERTVEEFNAVDILVNNAGLGLYAPIAEGNLENMRRLFEVNVWGTIHCIQAVVPHMRRQGQGQIINISSVAGKISTPYLGIYSATKFAVTAISDALRLELADVGIKVTTVYPGFTATPFREHAIQEVEMPPLPPLLRNVDPRLVAERVVRAARWEESQVYVSLEDAMAVLVKNAAPCLVDWGLRTFWPRPEAAVPQKSTAVR